MTDEGNERIHDNDAKGTHARDKKSTPVPKRGTQSAMRPVEDDDEGRVVTVQQIPSTRERALHIPHRPY